MIVDSMSYDEILQELKREEASVFAKMKGQLMRDHMSKFYKSFPSFPMVYTREITSNNRNLYIVLYYIDGKIHGNGKASVTNLETYKMAMHFREGKGYFAYLWNPSMPNMLFEMIPHFFARYAERMEVKGNPLDIVKHYLKHNRKALGTIAIYKNRTFTASVQEEGISLGVIDGSVSKTLTFVSYDMLFMEQKYWHDSMITNLKDTLLLESGTLEPKERRRVWREFVQNNTTNDDVFCDFWKVFARRHLRKNVEVTHNSFIEGNPTDIYLLVDKSE